ncbi:acyltransferase domain-containing protein [Kitasatospora sp. NBC_01287]|uniref:type I polyketide synthase n=1 Tax=Kitasatospora sp. NBC_01287 TaxID=2903573 RepID=UPI0022592D45|nr:type I polyketide synthase [Kitasatospora sp. NBC_01287]MCX4750481.1 acyltransferase domain-containing protein [Kitasatospora sp. NBC_01287]
MAGEDRLREYLQRATVELAGARRRLAEADARDHEPIAVIGMACRFPGAEGVDAYWDLLREGRAAPVGDVPPGRFDPDPRRSEDAAGAGAGSTATGGAGAGSTTLFTPRQGAFLPEVAGWDAEFFGFPAREALRMDPQQRLLMELAWEAMEDAGTPPPSLAGSRTGVLLGFSDAFQYGQVAAEQYGTDVYADPLMGQGTLASVVAGRLAYHFDLRGPTLSLDTACSSSLVATHLAVRALRGGECDYALAGGGYLALHRFLYVYSCATSLLSPTNRCHTFDRGADGYLMGEGGGLVMLARLSDALRDGHRVRAVIRGSAVNQDGRSNGLTAPNRDAQARVIRQALAAARTSPDEVSFLEAHGSGTPLGDEIELGALGDVFGHRSAEQPLHVGAVKTNIGHTHTAAGIAGLIKTVLVLERGAVPPNLHMDDPAEAVVAGGAVRPATALTPLAAGGRPPIAGVSSFGWSGTNAHLVLQAAPPAAPRETPETTGAGGVTVPELLPVSAAGPAALGAQLSRLAAAIGPADLADVAHTLRTGRAEHAWRRAVVATDTADAVARLTAAGAALDAAGVGASGAAGGRRLPERPRVAFLLPGVGDQYRGLGRALYRAEPVFAAAVDECVALAAERCGVDLRPALFADPPTAQGAAPGFFGRADGSPAPGDDPLEHAETAHPFLFTVQYALAGLLAHRGITPDLLVGYSLGEYVAACLAGVFTLPDALGLVIGRARLIEAAPAGRMLAVAAGEERLRAALAGCPAQVDVAALNGPGMTVLSGAPAEISAVAARLAAAGLAARELRSAHPFHSTLLRPARDELAALVAAVPRQAPRTGIVSNATGTLLTDEQATDPRYWAEHLCLPVRFAQSVRHCQADGIDAYLELGPGQVLGGLVRQNTTGDARPAVLGTLPAPWPAQDRPEENTALLESCGRLWELGVALDWSALRRADARLTQLPAYPFQRTRFWPQREPRQQRQQQRREAARSGSGSGSGAAQVPAEGLGYAPAWRHDLTRLPADAPGLTGTLVVLGGDEGAGSRLADLARAAGARVLEVLAGDGPRREGDRFVIDPALPEHYREVFAALGGAPAGPVQVVHLWSLGRASRRAPFATDAELRAAVRLGFDTLLLTVQALGAVAAEHGVRLLTVTAGAAEVLGGDATAPESALVHGLALGVRAEHPGLRWRGVDLHPGAGAREWADTLAAELRRGPWSYDDPAAEPALIAWRGGRRLLKGWAELAPAPASAPGGGNDGGNDGGSGTTAWNPDGAYLITGGTRGLGMALAEHLVRRGVRRLALVGRTDLSAARDGRPADGGPPDGRTAADERAARSLRDVARLEAAGATVLLLTADAGVPDELRAALHQARRHFGALHGVVHCAGVAGGGLAGRQTAAGAARVLAPKVLAMGPLAELVGPDTPAELRPKLLVLYSSIATVLGGIGEGDYCAANSVLDAYGTALAAAAPDTQVISVAWGQWQHDDWQTELTGTVFAEQLDYRKRYGFTDEDGCALLERLVGGTAGGGGGVSGSVVAPRQPLPQAVREWSGITDLEELVDAAAGASGSTRFPRPPLRTDYAAPRSSLETTVAEVWGDFLGIDRVGVHDPFFDLGGTSLVGMAMVTAIERLLDQRIAPAVLFAHPTVAAFSAALAEPDGARPQDATVLAAGATRGERRRRAGGTRTSASPAAGTQTSGTQKRGHRD